MTKATKLLILWTLALTGSCDMVPATALSQPSPVPSTPVIIITHTENHVPQIHVTAITGASPDEAQTVRAAEQMINSVMAIPCFKSQVLAAHYTEIGSDTQAQVWQKLADYSVSTSVDVYTGTWWANHIWKTDGYEDVPNTGVTHVNRYWMRTAKDIAALLAHEAEGHLQGFDHLGTKATSEPYGMNQAFSACAP